MITSNKNLSGTARKMTRSQMGWLLFYVAGIIILSVLIHEGAHILTAMSGGVAFSELKIGFLGINPSVTLPQRLVGTQHLTLIHYAGGLTSGAALVLLYALFWVRKYRLSLNMPMWSMGLVTIVISGMQFASGYLEGRYHNAYIIGSMSFISATDVLSYAWGTACFFFHLSICPLKLMRESSPNLEHSA